MSTHRSERRTALSMDSGCIEDFANEPNFTMTVPAGNLTSGKPAANQQRGSHDFESHILIAGVDVSLNSGVFNQNLQNALGALVPGVQLTRATASLDAQFKVDYPRLHEVRGLGWTVTAFGVLGPIGVPAAATYAALTAAQAALRADKRGRWLTIRGRISSSNGFKTNGDNGFNRAIARAVAQSCSFSNPQAGFSIPRDGAPLRSMFEQSDACTGGWMTGLAVYARACTRFQEATSEAPPTPTPPPAPAPPAPAPPPQGQGQGQGQGQTGVPLPDAGRTCAVRIQTKMFLRPTATFATKDSSGRLFPEIASGTAITITGPRVGQEGLLGLYPVSVPGRGAGFGALNAEDFEGCTLFEAPRAPAARRDVPNPFPGVNRPQPVNRQVVGTDAGAYLGSDTGTNTYAYAAVAFLAVLALGGAVIYSQRKSNARQIRRRNRRHKRAR